MKGWLSKGANANLWDAQGNTPLDKAGQDEAMRKVLLGHGAKTGDQIRQEQRQKRQDLWRTWQNPS